MNAAILNATPKRIVMSGPSGFLGRRVVDELMRLHSLRREHGLEPGTLILLSGSPGRLMQRLAPRYSSSEQRGKIPNLRASRVDYYTQHDVEEWINHLGSIGAGGQDSVFLNLAAVAGPMPDKKDAMYAINYKACVAAAAACQALSFSHFIQSSTQATVTERAGQVMLATS